MKHLFTLLIVCLFFACTDEQSADLGDSAAFVKMYGGPYSDIAYLAKETPDGGFILLGTTEVEGDINSLFKIRLIKTDNFGNKEWENVYPPEFDTESTPSLKGRSLVIQDDGYLVVGDRINRTNGIDENESSLYFLKVGLDGVEDETSSMALSLTDPTDPAKVIGSLQGLDIIQDIDGNLVVLSAMQDNTNPENDMLLSNFDPNLNSNLCEKAVSGDWLVANGLPSIAKSLYQNPNTGEIVVGGTSGTKSNADFKVVVFNQCQSNPSSGGAFNTNGSGTFTAGQVVPYGNGYAVVGTTSDTSKPDNDMFITVTNSEGVPQRTARIKNIGENPALEGQDGDLINDEEGRTIAATSDGGFVIAGSSLSNTRGERDILVIKTDAFGTVQWFTRLGDTSDEYATYVEQCSDGGYIILGNTEFGGVDTMVLTKISKNGELN